MLQNFKMMQLSTKPSNLKLVSPSFVHFTKIKPLKSYQKCFLFHPNCSFGSCNIQMLEGNWKLKMAQL